MRKQPDNCYRQGWGLVIVAAATVAIIGVSAAIGQAERSPECVQLARIVAGREHSMLDSQRFRDTQQQAYRVCTQDPAAFRKLIRIS